MSFTASIAPVAAHPVERGSEMETLIWIAWASIPIVGVVVGFVLGAIGNLFGFDFWQVAITTGLAAAAFQAGKVFSI